MEEPKSLLIADSAAVQSGDAPGEMSPRRGRKRRQPNHAAASYARYSSELQDDTSIETQQDRCNEAAAADGLPIDPQLRFSDRAVSGTKLHRDGLDKLLAAAKDGQISRLYFFSLSRLARESVIGLAIVKRLVYVYGVRIISVTEAVDSSRSGWETQVQILFMQHERYVKELAENTFRGQKGNIYNNFSNGDYCFGFRSEPVPGTETTRRGRHRKPRMRYAIEPIAADWVKRIFHWFVVERRSIRWITRELNKLKAPKDHRSTTPDWHHQMVSRLLANSKLTGRWPWGRMKNVRDPETGLVFQDERPAEETQQWLREFAEVRIITDELFFKAQDILAENAKKNAKGRNADGEFTAEQTESGDANPRHLLAGLIECAICKRKFYVGGAFGNYLFCPGYANGSCTCRTMLPRELAERLILREIGERIVNDAAWLQKVVDCTLAVWERLQATLPNELRDTETALAEVNRRIQRLLDRMEGAETVEPDIERRIGERRAERQRLESKLEGLRQTARCVPPRPTTEWVTSHMQRLQGVLSSSTPAAAFALRDLAGGSIVVIEVRSEDRKRCHLQGHLRLRAGAALQAGQTDAPLTIEAELEDEVITIDFVDTNPLDAKAEKVKALWDEGKLGKDIAAILKCGKSTVTKLLKHWSKLHGVELPNGHARRMQIDHQSNPPLYKQIAARVGELYQRELLMSEIATEVSCDLATVLKSLRYWQDLQGLQWSDGRARRKQLQRKSRRRPTAVPMEADGGAAPA